MKKILFATLLGLSTLAYANVNDEDIVGLRNDEPFDYGSWAVDLRNHIEDSYAKTGKLNTKFIHSEAKLVSCPALNQFIDEIFLINGVYGDPDVYNALVKELRKHGKTCAKNDF